MVSRSLLALAFLTSATPALAQDVSVVSGGSHFTLFALGVIGLIIGRRAAMRDTDQD
ncbi:hypothetical protein [Altererythrobacter sp. Root672]|uniref:hypothetical protein n=1 Tax=Altererythrobacter sp. Root672 TaxID=1736584 RepID=UPI000AA203FB|nr:hypothetical protein [Altererythrobacter sp. Root672]